MLRGFNRKFRRLRGLLLWDISCKHKLRYFSNTQKLKHYGNSFFIFFTGIDVVLKLWFGYLQYSAPTKRACFTKTRITNNNVKRTLEFFLKGPKKKFLMVEVSETFYFCMETHWAKYGPCFFLMHQFLEKSKKYG